MDEPAKSKLSTTPLLMFIIAASSLGLAFFYTESKKSDDVVEEVVTEITWSVEIESGYIIKERSWFTSQYFSVHYDPVEKKYYVYLIAGNEYEYELVKEWVDEQLLEFEDLANTNERNVEYIDARDKENETDFIEGEIPEVNKELK